MYYIKVMPFLVQYDLLEMKGQLNVWVACVRNSSNIIKMGKTYCYCYIVPFYCVEQCIGREANIKNQAILCKSNDLQMNNYQILTIQNLTAKTGLF